MNVIDSEKISYEKYGIHPCYIYRGKRTDNGELIEGALVVIYGKDEMLLKKNIIETDGNMEIHEVISSTVEEVFPEISHCKLIIVNNEDFKPIPDVKAKLYPIFGEYNA